MHQFTLRPSAFAPDGARREVWINLDLVTWLEPYGADYTTVASGPNDGGLVVEGSLADILQLLEPPVRNEHARPTPTLPSPSVGLKTGKPSR